MYSAKVSSFSEITCFDLIQLLHIHNYGWVIHFDQLDFNSIKQFHVGKVHKWWLFDLVCFYYYSLLVYILRLCYHNVMLS